MPKVIGFDTGFFIRLTAAHPVATSVWQTVIDGKAEAVASCLTLFELKRLALQSRIKAEREAELQRIIPHVCRVLWIDAERQGILFAGAKASHTFGIPAMDALILESLVAAKAREIYTSDPDMERYKNKSVKIIRLT
ncbi:MAG: type II toxin-antitoxin system VapC family toxin [Rhizobacter sp.]|nr:type II toxin-antitoxin system VapC family toxin [Chlorobiales bacterium]